MHHRSLNWDLMQGYYKDVNLKVVNFQILDLNAEAIYEKAFEAATVLKELIENYGVRKFKVIEYSYNILRKFLYIVLPGWEEHLIQWLYI